MAKTQGKTPKIIKKAGLSAVLLLGSLVWLIAGLFIAIRMPSVQTALTQRLMAYLSAELHTKITIKGIDIEFIKSIVLEGLYVEDQHGDTLLFAGSLKADIDAFNYSETYMSVKDVGLYNATIKLKKYPGERGLSYRFIEKYFKQKDTAAHEPSPWKVDFGGIRLSNVNFAFIDTRYSDKDPGMDYEDIRVTQLNALFTDINPMGDSASFRIKNLSAREKSGFTVTDFSSFVLVADTFAKFDNLVINTPGSAIQGFIGFQFHHTDDIADDFVHLVKMDGHFSNSVVELGDVSVFATELIGIKKRVLFTGDIKGTVEKLRLNNVDLIFGERSHIAGNFSFNGLPDLETTDMNFRIREATTNKKDLEGIPVAPYGPGDSLKLPAEIGLLGNMYFTGSIEGFLNDFIAHGRFRSALGTGRLENFAMVHVTDSLIAAYTGRLSVADFQLGALIGERDLGSVTGNVSVDGIGFPNQLDSVTGRLEPFSVNVTGDISKLVYRGYPYSNIVVSNGIIQHNKFEGDLTINDPNLRVEFTGKVDASGNLPDLQFEATIDTMNLSNLGFTDTTARHTITGNVVMHLKGNTIDNVQGLAQINNLMYYGDTAQYNFGTSQFFAGPTNTGRRIVLESDIVSASIDGNFELLKLPDAVNEMMAEFLPAYFPPPSVRPNAKGKTAQNFSWNVVFHDNTKPLQAFVPGLEVASGTRAEGKFDLQARTVSFDLDSDSIAFKKNRYRKVIIAGGSDAGKDKLVITGHVERIQVNDTIGLSDFYLDLVAADNKIDSKIRWQNPTVKQNDGNIAAAVQFFS
ncbi:MAG TPA: hypothetical protein VI731_09860, partial [Bacteroidia bacterium]|nr:hypothetical protein [Bacteroidia bacterium]